MLAADSTVAGQALAGLRAKESQRTTVARGALAAAERERAAAERDLVALLDADLHTRAVELAAVEKLQLAVDQLERRGLALVDRAWPFESGVPTVACAEVCAGGLHDGSASGGPCSRFGTVHAW